VDAAPMLDGSAVLEMNIVPLAKNTAKRLPLLRK